MNIAIKNAVTSARRLDESRLLVIQDGAIHTSHVGDLPLNLSAGDLLVVNDAATLPSSLQGTHVRTGSPVEIRLMEGFCSECGIQRWRAVAFGVGDWRTPTERRASPPDFELGDRLEFAAGLSAVVEKVHATISRRLISFHFEDSGLRLWTKFYAAARPIQYSYLREELALWDQQTIFAGAPVALEPPSASFVLSWDLIFRLRAKGVKVVRLTHGTGISSTGDPAIDSRLPFPERYRIPRATQDAVLSARAEGRRVVAIGTGAVRALESWGGRDLGEGWQWTDLILSETFRRKIVTGLLTGMHEPGASHISLLKAFTCAELLDRAYARALSEGFLWHEYGDVCLIL